MSKRNKNRQGYKKTQVGWIPEEWECDQIGKYIDLLSGQHVEAKNYNSEGTGLPYLTGPTDFQNGFPNASKFTEYPKVICDEKDILITCKGSGTGTLVVADKKYCISRQIMAIRAIRINHYFALCLLKKAQSYFGKIAIGLIPGISRADILNFKIPLPPLPEQKKIAEILSAWDRAIEQVGKLIDAKERLKKGLMQQLLTGRMRFAGFGKPVEKKGELPEGWQEVRLGECLSKIVGGGTPSRDKAAYWDGPIPWATVKDISSGSPEKTIECITEIGLQSSSANLIPRGVNIVATRMAVGVSIRFECDVAINQDLKALFTKQDMLCDDYLHWILRCSEARLGSLGGGSTVSGIRLDDLKKLKITLPILPEQIRITAVLSVCDREIELLRKKLEKLKEQKKGLMHKLLTGEIRHPDFTNNKYKIEDKCQQ